MTLERRGIAGCHGEIPKSPHNALTEVGDAFSPEEGRSHCSEPSVCDWAQGFDDRWTTGRSVYSGDALRGSMLALGLPMAVDRSNDPEVEQVVMTLCRVLEEYGREPMSDADMALLLLLDVACGGMTAGMAARAWLDASAREAHGPNWRACSETASRNRLEALSEEATHRLTDPLDTSGRSTRESLSDLRQGV